jgi:hypothetical protein
VRDELRLLKGRKGGILNWNRVINAADGSLAVLLGASLTRSFYCSINYEELVNRCFGISAFPEWQGKK